MDETVVFIALTLGGMVHSTAGFGSALVAMPILTLVLSPAVATPLQNTVGLFLCALIWYQHRDQWPWRDSVPIIAFSLLGVAGICVISHGSSGETAMLNAIKLADEMARSGLVAEISAAFATDG